MLAECYYNLGEYNTSLQYERAVIKIMEQNFSDKIYFMWIQMSRAFQSMNQPDSALLYARNAYLKIKGTQIPGEISLLFPILGNAFAGKANYDSALFYYTMGIPVAAKYNFGTDLIDNYNGIVKVYKAKGNLDSAEWYSKKILTVKMGRSYPIGLLKAANMLADIYQSKNKPDSTLKYLRIAISLKDSLFNREKTIAIQNLTYKEQEKQKEIEASKIKLQNRFKIYFLLATLITILVITGILLRNKRLKQL